MKPHSLYLSGAQTSLFKFRSIQTNVGVDCDKTVALWQNCVTLEGNVPSLMSSSKQYLCCPKPDAQ